MENKNKQINISDKVLDKIEQEDVKMRSKWFFIAEKLGLESGLLLSILVIIILLCFTLYIMDQKGAFEFTEFGPRGWPLIFANIPFELIILAVVFFIVSSFLIKQFDFSYRKPFYLISCGVLLLIGTIGAVLTWTGASHSMFKKVVDSKMVKNYYENKTNIPPENDKAIIGRVVGYDNKSIYLVTTNNRIIKINFNKEPQVAQGQVIKIIGKKNGEMFQAEIIRVIKPNNKRYFRIMPTAMPSPTPTATNAN